MEAGTEAGAGAGAGDVAGSGISSGVDEGSEMELFTSVDAVPVHVAVEGEATAGLHAGLISLYFLYAENLSFLASTIGLR